MTDRKRKAEHDFSRESALIEIEDEEMARTEDDLPFWRQAVGCVIDVFKGLFMPATATDRPNASTNARSVVSGHEHRRDLQLVAADAGIQTPLSRREIATTSKRQKITPTTKAVSQSRSMPDEHRRVGRGSIDIPKDGNEEEKQRKLDRHWEPPPLPGRVTKTARPSQPAAQQIPAEEQKFDRSYTTDHYKAAKPYPTPTSSSSSHDTPELDDDLSSNKSPSWDPSTPESTSQKDERSTKPKGGLDEHFGGLGISSDEPITDGPFIISTTKQLQLTEIQKREALRIKEAKRQDRIQRRLVRRRPLRTLVIPLESKWEDYVTQAEYTRDHNMVLAKSLEGTELRLKDFSTLLGRRAWLNDEIINAYIEWVVTAANKLAEEEAKENEETYTVPKFIAHNSFFYENIRKKGPVSTERLMKRKKAPGTSLLEVDTVFVPICQGAHWTIGVVRPVAKTIEYFDSMGGNSAEFTRQMRGWLKFQLKDKYVEEEWKVPRPACANQTNGYDCGVFVCTNAFCVAFGLDTSCYAERDMTLQRRNIAAVLINSGFKGDFVWRKGDLLS